MGGGGLAGNPAAPAALPAGEAAGHDRRLGLGWSELGRRGCRRGGSTAAGGGGRGDAGSGEEGARGGQSASLGGSTGPRGEGGTFGWR
jgi:hypothetical protein